MLIAIYGLRHTRAGRLPQYITCISEREDKVLVARSISHAFRCPTWVSELSPVERPAHLTIEHRIAEGRI
jgi:hypothetical protein